MKATKKIVKVYSYSVLWCGCVVTGYDLAGTKRMPSRDRAVKIGKDISKTLIWPITAPKAIKEFTKK